MTDVVDAVFDLTEEAGPARQCAATTPAGTRCGLYLTSPTGLLCHVHRAKVQSGRRKMRKHMTTVYLRADQVVWLREMADAAGVSVAEVHRQAIDYLRRDIEAQQLPKAIDV